MAGDTLLPTEEIIKISKEGGADFGPGNAGERIRYLIKLGLLPHAVRKLPATSLPSTVYRLPSTPIGHLPYLCVQRLIEITQLNKNGLTFPQIAAKIKAKSQALSSADSPEKSLALNQANLNPIPYTLYPVTATDPPLVVKVSTIDNVSQSQLDKKLKEHEKILGLIIDSKLNSQFAVNNIVSSQNFDFHENKLKKTLVGFLFTLSILTLLSGGAILGYKTFKENKNNNLNGKQIAIDISKSGEILAASSANHKLYIDADSEFSGTTLFKENITAPNVVYSVKAGTGIAVTPGQNPIVSLNTAAIVPSVNDASGPITLKGTGSTSITNSGGVITISSSSSTSGLTSEADTLSTVTGRGATTATATSFTGGATIGTSLTLSAFSSNGGVLYTNGSGVLAQVTAGTSSQCLLGGTTPSFGTCSGSGGVTSLDSLTGALTISNSSGSGTTVTIDDATTAAKGIASFSSGNFSVTSGAVSIKTGGVTSTEIFDGTIAGGDLASNIAISTTGNIATTSSGTITSASTLTASNGLTLTTGALTLTATSGSLAATGFGTTSLTSTTTTGNINTLTDISLAPAAAATANLLNLPLTTTAVNTSGTATTSAVNIALTNNNVGSGGIQNLFGVRIQDITGTSGAGTQNNYGIRIGNQGLAATELAYGLYIDSQSGSTANYGLVANGNINFPALTASQVVLTDSNSNLTTGTATAANTCSDCLIQVPLTTLRNTIAPTTNTVVPLTIDALTTPTATTAGVLDINASSSTDNNRGIDLAYTFNNTAAATNGYGIYSLTTHSNTTNANVAYGNYHTLVDSTALGNTNFGAAFYGNTTGDGAVTKNVYGVYSGLVNDNTATDQGTRNTYAGYFTAVGSTRGTATTYGIYTAASGADNNYNLYGAAISTAATANYGLSLSTLGGGTTANYQISTGILTSATTTTNAQINLGGVVTTGGTTNYGINVGALSGTGTSNYGINIATLTSTGTTSTALNIGGLTGAATTNGGIVTGAISGVTTNSYGLQLGTLTGGSTNNIQIQTGAITDTGTLNIALDLGGLSGSVASSVNYGIRIGAISGAGATTSNNYGISIGNLSAAITNVYGINIGTLGGGTGSNIYGINTGALTSATSTPIAYQINLGTVAGIASATFGGINVGGISGAGTTSYGINVGANSSTATTNYGINITALTSVGTTDYGINIGGLSGASTTNYGLAIGALSTATTSEGINIGALSSATSTGIDIGAFTGATTNTGINIASFATATTSKGVVLGTNSSATAYGIDIGALSGATTNVGIKIGAISGTGTGTGIDIGAFTNTGATQYGINIGAFSGTHNGGTTAGINIGAITSAGTTTNNYGLLLSTLTGGTTANYQISTGTLTAIASAINTQLNLGAITNAASSTTYGISVGAISGAAASSTSYGINIGAISGSGTASYGLNIGANSATDTTNFGINVGAVTGAGTTNYGLYLDAVSGASTNYNLYGSSANPNYFLEATASTLTSGVLTINDTTATSTNTAVTVNYTFNGSANGSNQAQRIISTLSNSTASTLQGLNSQITDSSSVANTLYAVSGQTISINSGGAGYGGYFSTSSSTTGAGNSLFGVFTQATHPLFAYSSGTANIFGIYGLGNGKNSGATMNNYGGYFTATSSENAISPNTTTYGVYGFSTSDGQDSNNTVYGGLFNATHTTTATGTGYGLYASASGSATNYAGYFNSDVGIRKGTPVADATAGVMSVATGTFVGTGASGNAITGIGFQPDMVIIFPDSDQTRPAFRTSDMSAGISCFTVALSACTSVTSNITSLNSNGFTVSSNYNSGVKYQYVAIKDNGNDYAQGTYSGNGTSQSITGLGFKPDYVFTHIGSGASIAGCFTQSTLAADATFQVVSAGTAANKITSLDADGFSVGSDNCVNRTTESNVYYWFAFKNVPGRIKVGTYTGNATDNTNITGVGFKPDYLQERAVSTQTSDVVRTRTFRGDNSATLTNTQPTSDKIQNFINDGFEVGTLAVVNSNTVVHHYLAFRDTETPALTIASTEAGTTNHEALDIYARNISTTGGIITPLNINLTNAAQTVADTFIGNNLLVTDSTALANTVYGTYNNVFLEGAAAKIGYANYNLITSSSTTADTLYGNFNSVSRTANAASSSFGSYNLVTSTSTTADSLYGAYFKTSATGDVARTANYGAIIYGQSAATATGDSVYGLHTYALSGAAANAATQNSYGIYSISANGAASATATAVNAYGGIFSAVGISANVTTGTAYGVFAAASGGNNNYAIYTSAGTVQFTCTTSATTWTTSQANPSCSDYAEVYDTNDSNLEHGDIITVDHNNQNKVTKSQEPYQQDVIGIFSTSPGLLIGPNGIISAGGETSVGSLPPGKVPVALSGQVPVKVSTQNGPIQPGDLLTTSSIPGVAMKADPTKGSTIGHSLENYSEAGIGGIMMVMETRSGYNLAQALQNTDLQAQSFSTGSNNTTIDSFGNVTTAGNVVAGGTLSAANGKFTVDSSGNITTNGEWRMANGNFLVDTLGNVQTSGSITAQSLNITGDAAVSGQLSAVSIQTSSIQAPSGQSLTLSLSDSLGTSSFKILDSMNHQLLTINSKGDADFSGTVNADAFVTHSTADLAEAFPTTDSAIEPGDIVAADPNNKESIQLSNQPYQSTLLGIISTKPGLTLNAGKSQALGPDDTQDKSLALSSAKSVALAGRVPTKVNLENGPIKAGDPITSSSTPGVGMRATQAGRVIGIALENYNPSPNIQNPSSITVFVNPSWYTGQSLAANGSFTDSLNTQSQALGDGGQGAKSLALSQSINPDGTLSSVALAKEDTLTEADIKQIVDKQVDAKIDSLIASGRLLPSSQQSAVNIQQIDTPVPTTAVLGESTASASINNEPALPAGRPSTMNQSEASASATIATGAQIASETDATLTKLNELLSTVHLSLDTLNVTGSSNLAQTQVAGTFSQDGTFIIDYGKQLNVLGSTLYLQNDPFAGDCTPASPAGRLTTARTDEGSDHCALVDIGNGKVTIDKLGNLTTLGTITAKNIETKEITLDTADANAKSAGTAILASGKNQVTIFTTLVKPNAKILITPTTSTGGKQLYVATKSEFEGFTVAIDGAIAAKAIEFDWLIINTQISQAN